MDSLFRDIFSFPYRKERRLIMLELIWIISTFIVYGFEIGVMALIFIGLTTRKGRNFLRRCIGL